LEKNGTRLIKRRLYFPGAGRKLSFHDVFGFPASADHAANCPP
jgi:hypothetical protein